MTVASGIALVIVTSIMAALSYWFPAADTQYLPIFTTGNRDHVILLYPPPEARTLAVHALMAAADLYLVVVLAVTRAPQRWRRVVAHPLTGLAYLAGTVLIVNAVVAACDRECNSRYLPDADLQWVHNPAVAAAAGEPTNEFGLRTPDLPRDRAPGVTRLLVLGDSATWGAGHGEPAPYPRQVEWIARRNGLDIEVVNAAVVGYCSLQGLRVLPRLLAHYRPDIVAFGYNNDSSDDGGMPDRLRTPSAEWARAVQRCLYRFDVYLLLRQQILNAAAALHPERPRTGPTRQRIPLDEHLANHEAIIDRVEASGARPVILILPSAHGRYDDADQALAKRRGVLLIDLHALFSLARKPAAVLLPDNTHPTAEAHVLLGEIVLRQLIEAGYLPRTGVRKTPAPAIRGREARR